MNTVDRTICARCHRPEATHADRPGPEGLCWSGIVFSRWSVDACLLEATRLRYVEQGAPAIGLKPSTSTCFSAVGYDFERQTLRLQFRAGKSLDYLGITPTEFRRFVAAPSLGKAYGEMFRGVRPSLPLPAKDCGAFTEAA